MHESRALLVPSVVHVSRALQVTAMPGSRALQLTTALEFCALRATTGQGSRALQTAAVQESKAVQESRTLMPVTSVVYGSLALRAATGQESRALQSAAVVYESRALQGFITSQECRGSRGSVRSLAAFSGSNTCTIQTSAFFPTCLAIRVSTHRNGGKPGGDSHGLPFDGSRFWQSLFPPASSCSRASPAPFHPLSLSLFLTTFSTSEGSDFSVLVTSPSFPFPFLSVSPRAPFFRSSSFSSTSSGCLMLSFPSGLLQAPSGASSRSNLRRECWLLSLGSAFLRLPLANRPVSTRPGSPEEQAQGPLPDVQSGSLWVVLASTNATSGSLSSLFFFFSSFRI